MNTTQTTDTTILYNLTESERLDARETARENVIRRYGDKPQRAQFDDHNERNHPAYVVVTVTAIMLVLLVAFFVLSAMRLYTIGSHTYGETLSSWGVSTIAGVAIVIGSEAGALGFLLAAGVLTRDWREKWTLNGLAILSAALALVGNVQFSLGGSWYNITADPFGTLEAFLPPIVVLGGGMVIKRIWLNDIEHRHANERAYQAALAEWQALTAEPEQSPYWRSVYASALRTKLIAVNGSGRGKTDREHVMQQMTTADWRRLVWHEMRADDWFAEPEPDMTKAPYAIRAGDMPAPLSNAPQNAPYALTGATISSNGNGKAHGA